MNKFYNLKLNWILIRVGFLKFSTYLEATLVSFISGFIFILVQYFVWKSIGYSSGSASYGIDEIYSYIVFSQVLYCIFPNQVSRQLTKLISSGDISFVLLKPLTIFKQLFVENLGTSLYKFIFVSIPILASGFIIGNINIKSVNIPIFLFVIVLSYMIYFILEMIFGILAFYTTSSWGISSLKYAIITLLAGRFMPISLYPLWAQSILSVMPFKFMYDIPIEILLGNNITGASILIVEQLISILVLLLIYIYAYSRALKRLVIQGG